MEKIEELMDEQNVLDKEALNLLKLANYTKKY